MSVLHNTTVDADHHVPILLPIELCESIIDFVAAFRFDKEWRVNSAEPGKTLASCALVCSQWLPRSRFHLYQRPTLRGDRLTHRFIETIRSGDFTHYIHAITSPAARPGPHPMDSSLIYPFHVVPALLSGLPRQSLQINIFELIHHQFVFQYGEIIDFACHNSFFMTLQCYHSVHTVHLFWITFSSFQFLARFILSFPSLRHLDLACIGIMKVNTHPAHIARRKNIHLHSLTIRFGPINLLPVLFSWLVDGRLVQSLQKLDVQIHRLSEALVIHTSHLLDAAGTSLKQFLFAARDAPHG